MLNEEFSLPTRNHEEPNNYALTNLVGLSNLTSIGYAFNIIDNDVLTSLTGLNSLNSIGGGGLTIRENAVLTNCALSWVCNQIYIGGGIDIESNAGNCNNIDEVAYACGTITYSPQITLSASTVAAGQPMIISGKYFTPNSNITLLFSGAVGSFQINVVTNASGVFTYTYTAPSNPTASQLGISTVKALNVATGTYSGPKNFKITTSTIPSSVAYLILTSPQAGSTYSVGENIHVDFNDKLQKKYGTFTYPMVGATANRQYRYRVEYQVGSTGTWQLVTMVQGSALLNSTINKSVTLQFNVANANCRVRVVDDFVSSIVQTSPVFPVNAVVSNLKVEKHWDYSFPAPLTPVQGVAADGVARIYIKVSKLNPALGATIQKVDISLSDGINNNNPAMLGKVQVANVIDAYSTEANNAISLSATDETPIGDGDFYFWYVAPDNFSNFNSIYNDASERKVTIHVVAHLAGGATDIKDITIKVVRPPLVMVHGLASNSSAFNQFHYDTGTSDIPFTISSLFKQKRAINLSPDAPFAVNALQLVSPTCPGCSVVSTTVNRNNTLKGNIDDLRQQGYAANQVDYVCHSMGGSVMRTAMTVWASRFYGTGSGASSLDKSYGKGFVHKAITINTPHEGSPVADFVTEYVPDFSFTANILMSTWYGYAPNGAMPFDFIKPTDPGSLPFSPWEASSAVKDLQVNNATGGENLAETTVKNHLISGDIDLYDASTASFLSSIDKYVEFIDEVLAAAIDQTNDPYLIALAGANKALRVFTFTEWYSEQKGFPNFLGDGDMIVPRASQLAGNNAVSDHSTIFYNSSLLNANHLQILDRADVGNRVKDLLNSSVFSDLFASTIPATTNLSNPSNNVFEKKNGKLLTTSFDTLKVVIDAPQRGEIVLADSSLEISFRLKDTASLNYIQVIFQGQSSLLTSKAPNQGVNFQVDPNFLGNRLILVDASYNTPNGADHHIDSLSVYVATNAQLLGFEVLPEVVSIFKNIPYHPTCQATYDAFIVGVPFNDNDLAVAIANQSIVQFDTTTHSFTGIGDGSTYAVISYHGFSDTIYIEVLDNNVFAIDYTVTPITCGGGGSDGAIDLTALGSGGTFSYLWSNGATTEDLSNLPTGNYTVTVTDGLGATIVETIEIAAPIVPTASITPSSQVAICQGQSVLLEANTGPEFTFQWSLNNVDISGATDPTYMATQTGFYRVLVSSGSNCSATSVATQVIVNAAPTASITPSGTIEGCQGSLVSLSANAGAGYSYQWKLNGTNITGATAQTYAAAAGGTYTVEVTNSFGCTMLSTATTVNVVPAPTAEIMPTGSAQICEGQNIMLSASMGANLSWQWQRNGNNLTGATSQQFSATVTGTYMVVVTNSAGCSAVSPGVQVSVLTYPVASISPPGNVAVCEGQSVTLDAGVGTNLTYQWQLNGGNIGGAIGSTYPASAAGDYVVVVTNGSLCTATSSAVTVQVNPLPNVMAAASDNTICDGGTTTLNGTGAQGYTWQPGNLQGASVEVTPLQSTVYTLTGIDQNNCANTATVEITVNPNPTINLGADVTICDDATLTLHAGAGFTSYLWSTGATSEEITVEAGGSYSVTVVDQNGCSGVDEIVITEMVCNATNNTLKNSQVQLYPNPNSGNFMLLIDSEVTGDLILEVVNHLGQVVSSVGTTKTSRVFQYDFALDDLPASVYLLKIRLDGLMGWKKIVVER